MDLMVEILSLETVAESFFSGFSRASGRVISLTLNCIRGVPWYPTFGFSALAF